MEIIITAAAYCISYILSGAGMYTASGILLMAAATILAVYYCARYGRRINPPAVFALSWVGGSGIACLKLSYLETDWETLTWVIIFAAYACFVIGYKLVRRAACRMQNRNTCEKQNTRSIYIMMNAIAIVSVISLIIEASLLGYIPLFTTDTPHAYSYFHISGLHYFTVSCCLLPALGTLCIWHEMRVCRGSLRNGTRVSNEAAVSGGAVVSGGAAVSTDSKAACGDTVSQVSASTLRAEKIYNDVSAGRKLHMPFIRKADIGICMGIGVLIPILLVSRYQLFFGILLAGICMLILNGMRIWFRLNIKYVLTAAVIFFILLMLYVFITIERAHSVEYLNGIFEMKYEHMPIFLSQPYIYIANNFDNLNCLVRELAEHTLGLRMLFPFIALTGLKFLKPELVAFPIYVTKEELTTVTLIYDSYYDFGLIGVIVFCFAVGAAAALIERKAMQAQTMHAQNKQVMQGLCDNAAYSSAGRHMSCAAAEEAGISVGMDEQAHDTGKAQISEVSCGGKAFTVLLYAQVMIYLCLAFFTTWLSNPTTWFLFGLTVMGMIIDICIISTIHRKGFQHD